MSINSIPASRISKVIPGVLAAGGTGLDLSGVLLTQNLKVPNGSPLSFSTAVDVASYFGATSDEAAYANVYFNGFDGSTKKPATLLISLGTTAPTSAFLRGGSMAATPLATLQALPTGTLSVAVDGVVRTAPSFSMSALNSFSAIAAALAAALTVPVVYDSTLQTFQISSTSTGITSTLALATGTLAIPLGLTSATGAVLSQGQTSSDPLSLMTALARNTQNWATFSTLYEPSIADKAIYAKWTNDTGNNKAYFPWDTDASAITQGSTSSFGSINAAANYSGVTPIYAPVLKFLVSALYSGIAASIDFQATEGRITFKFKGQSGLLPDVTDGAISDTLIANGYDFYGSYATAAQEFRFAGPGRVGGPFKWLDSYVNQIWMNNSFQLDNMILLTQVFSVPYNEYGRALMRAALADTINAALNFGAIRAGVTLSSLQVAEINGAAGIKIDDILSRQGYYLQIKDAAPATRAARSTPPCRIWYMDGGSVHSITLASTEVQ